MSLMADPIQFLHNLARLCGVQVSYRDATGRRQVAEPEALLAVLKSLGAPVAKMADVRQALREQKQVRWQCVCEPVVVGWSGEHVSVKLRLPAGRPGRTVLCRLELENGEVQCWSSALTCLTLVRTAVVEGVLYEVRRLVLPPGLPWGYHRLTLTLAAGTWETLLIVAPRETYVSIGEADGRLWGVFLPLYALHAGRSWGAGDLSDLGTLMRWVRELGGHLVGTLPLLAVFLDEPFEPSPYVPVSRLFWNEFYLDVTAIPELGQCAAALEILNAPGFRDEVASLRSLPLVDYRRGMALKRAVLEPLAKCCFDGDSGRLRSLMRWARTHPAACDYARFRAVAERQRVGWPVWPERLRNGVIDEGDYDPAVERYHLYVQWLLHERLEALSAQARDPGPGLYLDLPLGVHSDGYDTWRERANFALDISVGAPPDPFFDQGQDWGFPPLHPERLREQGYRYYIAGLRHHLRHAAALRLDHVMGLHRFFWIPRGMEARAGVYVRYPATEFYAILALESHRYRTLIIGEDLGTVPGYVRQTMARHKVQRMYILPFERQADPVRTLRSIPSDALAALNTHDTPPFAAFWEGQSVMDRAALRFFLHRQGWPELPPDETGTVLRACLAHLAASRARTVLVNLEDLWLETKPQNEPGTGHERPNWRRKARYAFEDFSVMPHILETLGEINGLRGGMAHGQEQRDPPDRG